MTKPQRGHIIVLLTLALGNFSLAQQPTNEVRTLELGKPIERDLAAKEVQIYGIKLTAGEVLRAVVDQRGIAVRVNVFGPNGAREQFSTPDRTQGPVAVTMDAKSSGDYFLHIRSLTGDGPPGRYEVKIEEVLTGSLADAWRTNVTETVKNWLVKNAIPIRTVETGHGFADLQPLKAMIGSARVVALGESNHGTREFAQFKHRMLEFLVSEMGFTAFGIEATMPEGFDINEYVLTGKGDPVQALAGLYFWISDTEEVLEMIQWMRRYNANPQHARKVKFYGLDIQSAPRAVKVTLEYLRRLDSKETASFEKALAVLANPFTAPNVGRLSKEKRDDMEASVNALLTRLDERKQDYVRQSSDAEYSLAFQHARIIAQNLQLRGASSVVAGQAVRDRSMATNIAWILQHEGPGTKMVTWAHNSHVVAQRRHLREALGSGVVAFGFVFNQGSFRAVEMGYPSREGLHSFTVGPAPEGSLDAMLASAGKPLAVVDLHAVSDGGVAEWFSKPHATRQGGAAFSEEFGTRAFSPTRVMDGYDALFFVETITPSRPAEGGKRPGDQTLPAPVNLDFESGGLGKPSDWVVPPGVVNFTYQVTLDRENPHGGKQSSVIRRTPGKQYGETFGSLNQQLDATAYRGKHVHLRAWVRTEVRGPGNQAYVWLRVSRPRDGSGSRGFYDNMADRPITASEWHEYEISGDVAPDAVMIDYGLALVGEGRAWLDDGTIDFN